MPEVWTRPACEALHATTTSPLRAECQGLTALVEVVAGEVLQGLEVEVVVVMVPVDTPLDSRRHSSLYRLQENILIF